VVTALPLLVLVGPTGVGKTVTALCLAERLSMEAVSADSRQVYRWMDIGTGKPTAEQRQRLPHHLIDIVDPDQGYDAARFRRDGLEAIAAVRSRGRLPLVVGGTGLYVRALLKGLRPAPPADPELRAALEAEAIRHGTERLHDRLGRIDPRTAARLHPRDRVRIVRALEVRLQAQVTAEPPRSSAGDWASAPAFRLLMVGLAQERGRLNRRLTERVRDMVARGMMDEVRALMDAGYDVDAPGMGSIGYRQLAAVARGRLGMEEALRLMTRDTTRYAKRQMTWFARDREVRWLDVDEAGGVGGAATQIARWAEEELIG
jgi:tRNA dimethylallyltransferase